MATCTDVRTPFRRPCLLRAEVELNVDAPEGKRTAAAPFDANATGVVSGGASAPDWRAVTLDMPARHPPRCAGLRKGAICGPTNQGKQTKTERSRAIQGLGIAETDMDLVMTRGRRCTSADSRPGVGMQSLFGDEQMRGIRCEGLRARSRSPGPLEEKAKLDRICIDHQFRQRHSSAPPEGRSLRDAQKGTMREHFDHCVRAEEYANLIGRPEGAGKRRVRPGSKSPRARKPFHVDRGLKDSLFASTWVPFTDAQRGEGMISDETATGGLLAGHDFFPQPEYPPLTGVAQNAPDTPAQTAALISALREATRNTPAESVCDAMLSALVESPELFVPQTPEEPPQPALPARLAALLAANTSSETTEAKAPHMVSPMKNQSRFEESPQKIAIGRKGKSSLGGSSSEHSLMSPSPSTDALSGGGSLSTSAGGGSLSVASTLALSASGGSLWLPAGPSASPRPQSRAISGGQAVDWLRQEQLKARRRAAWVA